MTFAAGSVVPLIVVVESTLLGLAVLGGLGTNAGGAGVVRGAARVNFWGDIAMAATARVSAHFSVSAG